MSIEGMLWPTNGGINYSAKSINAKPDFSGKFSAGTLADLLVL